MGPISGRNGCSLAANVMVLLGQLSVSDPRVTSGVFGLQGCLPHAPLPNHQARKSGRVELHPGTPLGSVIRGALMDFGRICTRVTFAGNPGTGGQLVVSPPWTGLGLLSKAQPHMFPTLGYPLGLYKVAQGCFGLALDCPRARGSGHIGSHRVTASDPPLPATCETHDHSIPTCL